MRDYARLQTAILLRRLAFQVGRVESGDAESIHDLRVAIRRLRNCLRVFAPFYPGHSGKKIRHRLGELMELAGAVRNLDITLQLLSEAGVPPVAAIAAHLREERLRARLRLHGEVRLWKARGFSRKWRSRLGL